MSSANWIDNSGYTHLELYPNGNYKSFVPTTDTEWRLGQADIKLKADKPVHFYDNGNFKFFTLCDNAKIKCHGADVTVAEESVMEFYEDGGVKRMIIAAQSRGFFSSSNWPYQGKEYPPGCEIQFAPDGKVTSVKI